MITQLFNFYLENQNELVKTYNGKYVVISEQKEIRAYDSEEKAYKESLQDFGEGKFLLQYCSSGKEAYTKTCYNPMISF